MREYGVADLRSLIGAAAHAATETEVLYFVAATSHLVEGWRDRVPRFELGSRSESPLEPAIREAAQSLGFPLVWETPAQIIPLPPKWEVRSRPVPGFARPGLDVRHFDPYSVVLRLVARGDEPDYLAALEYLAHGWVELTVLESLLGDLLPRFTSATLAQDPAEFRRKFRGLRQLRASVA